MIIDLLNKMLLYCLNDSSVGPQTARKQYIYIPPKELYTPKGEAIYPQEAFNACSLILIDFTLVFKAFERFGTFRPSNSLGHRQNSKKVYYKLRTDFASDHFSSRTGGLKRLYASPLMKKCASTKRTRVPQPPTTPKTAARTPSAKTLFGELL